MNSTDNYNVTYGTAQTGKGFGLFVTYFCCHGYFN